MLNNIALQMLQKLPNYQQIAPILQMVQNSQNPMVLLEQKYGNNPIFQKVMNSIKGKSPQEIEQFVKNTFFTQTNIKI